MTTKNRFGAAETALTRHETFQGAFRLAINAAFAASLLGVACLGTAIWALTSKPEPRYFAATEDGGILPLVAVNQPFLNEGQVTNFAVEAITRAYTLDFANWRRDLSEASEYFVRPDGWNNYLTAIEGSGTLEFVRNRRLVSNAVANGATVVRSGLDESGVYSWTVQVPLTVTYTSSSETKTDELLAEILVSRVPTWQMPGGVGIKMIVVRNGRS